MTIVRRRNVCAQFWDWWADMEKRQLIHAALYWSFFASLASLAGPQKGSNNWWGGGGGGSDQIWRLTFNVISVRAEKLVGSYIG